MTQQSKERIGVAMSDKLPQMQGGMRIGEALFLELMNILVDEGIISEEKALQRYHRRFIGSSQQSTSPDEGSGEKI